MHEHACLQREAGRRPRDREPASEESLSASPRRAGGGPIPDIQQNTDRSDSGQRAERQGIGAIRTEVDPEHFTDHELDV